MTIRLPKSCFIFVVFSFSLLIAQETIIKLPTNDNTSSFNITKNNGTSLFKVEGSGKITGDGSGLSNVKAIATYEGDPNNNTQILENYGSYKMVQIIIMSVPAEGIINVTASGYVDWESRNWDLVLLGILDNDEGDPNSSYIAETQWYNYLNIITDYNCTDSSDQYTSFTNHRTFYVNSGTYRYSLWANKHSTTAKVKLSDVNMSAIYIPTGGTGQAVMPGPTPQSENIKVENNHVFGSVDGITPHNPNEPIIKPKEWTNIYEKYNALESELEELKRLATDLQEEYIRDIK